MTSVLQLSSVRLSQVAPGQQIAQLFVAGQQAGVDLHVRSRTSVLVVASLDLLLETC